MNDWTTSWPKTLKTCNENWCSAAERALAGDDRALRARVEMHRAPPIPLVASEGT